MAFFNNIYDKIAASTASSSSLQIGGLFILMLVLLIVLFVALAVLTICNRAYKLRSTSKKISKFIAGIQGGYINYDNLADFEAQCIAKAPLAVRESWSAFIEVKFGYPSDYLTDEACVTKPRVEYCREFGVSLFNACAVVLIGIFFIFGMTVSDLADVLEKALYCVITAAIASFLLVLIGRLVTNDALKAFFKAQEELDAACDLQEYKTAEPVVDELSDVADAIDAVIAEAVIDDPDAAKELEEDEDDEIEDMYDGDEDVAVDTDTVVVAPVEDEAEDNEVAVEAPVEETEEENLAEETEEAAIDEVDDGFVDDEYFDNEVTDAPIILASTDEQPAEEPAGDYVDEYFDDEVQDSDSAIILAPEAATEEPQAEQVEDVYDDDDDDAPDDAGGDFFPVAERSETEASENDSAKDETASAPLPEEIPVEIVKPAEAPVVKAAPSKYAKLPGFFPILLKSKCSRATYIKITKVFIGAYSTAKNPEDKAILKDALKTCIVLLSRK